jgi:hypothetical protein
MTTQQVTSAHSSAVQSSGHSFRPPSSGCGSPFHTTPFLCSPSLARAPSGSHTRRSAITSLLPAGLSGASLHSQGRRSSLGQEGIALSCAPSAEAPRRSRHSLGAMDYQVSPARLTYIEMISGRNSLRCQANIWVHLRCPAVRHALKASSVLAPVVSTFACIHLRGSTLCARLQVHALRDTTNSPLPKSSSSRWVAAAVKSPPPTSETHVAAENCSMVAPCSAPSPHSSSVCPEPSASSQTPFVPRDSSSYLGLVRPPSPLAIAVPAPWPIC